MIKGAPLIRHLVFLLLSSLCGLSSVWSQTGATDTERRLRSLYAGVEKAGNRFIVDQGLFKALYNLRGEPVTGFWYRTIWPGLDGNFIALAADHQQPYELLDSGGNRLRTFLGEVVLNVGSRGRFYSDESGLPSRDAHGNWPADASGFFSVYNTQTYRRGFVGLRDRTHRLQGLRDTAGRIVVAPGRYSNIVVRDEGILVQSEDSCFFYDTTHRLRFRYRADASTLLPGGIIAVKRYELWALKDSNGHPLSGFQSYRQPEVVGSYIFTSNGIWDFNGRLRLAEPLQTMYLIANGWYQIDGYENDDNRLLDENLKPVFAPGTSGRTQFVGNRYVVTYKDYNDRLPRVFDRKTRTFIPYPVSWSFSENTYVVVDKKQRTSRILRNGLLLSAPLFSGFDVKPEYGLVLLVKDTARTGEYDSRNEHNFYSSLISSQTGKTFGVIDTAARIILPIKFSGVEVLSANVLAAAYAADSSIGLFDRSGRLLYKTRAKELTVRRAGTVIYAISQSETAVFDTTGKLLYQGRFPPELLYVTDPAGTDPHSYQPYPGPLPSLVLVEESLAQWSVRDMTGKKLLPAFYRPVKSQVAGLFSLKRGDSVYAVNAAGRLLYGGRGLPPANHILMESFAALVKGPNGKWGMMNADGALVLPFDYDSAGRYQFNYQQPASQYFLRRAGKFTWIDNAGRVLSADGDWLPALKLFDDYYQGNNNRVYAVKEGRAIEFAEGQPPLNPAGLDFDHSLFHLMNCCGDSAGGVYNRQLKRVATSYRGKTPVFNAGKVTAYDSTGTRLYVVDTAGRVLLPMGPAPATLVLKDHGVLAIDSNGGARIYSETDGIGTIATGTVDAAFGRTISEEKPQRYGWSPPYFIRNSAGVVAGYVNGDGRYIQRQIDAARVEKISDYNGFVSVKFREGWALFSREMEPLTPDVFDTIVHERDYFRLYRNGLQGLFTTGYYSYRYLPPRYEILDDPSTLRNGYLLASTGGEEFLIDQRGRMVTPKFDELREAKNGVRNMVVVINGKQALLNLDSNGEFRIQRLSQDGSGLPGYPPLEILWEGKRAGLRNSETGRIIEPVRYDFITRKPEGHFVAWKYKADKHDGVDSTLVFDASGKRIFAFKGGNNPEFKDGFWALNNSSRSPILNATGGVILGEAYSLLKVLGGKVLVIVKDDKIGLLSERGTWLLQPQLDGLEDKSFTKTGLLVGRMTTSTGPGTTDSKYFLLNAAGKRITAAIYDEIEINSQEDIRFKRGETWGCMNAAGKEIKCPVIEEE